MLFVPLQEMEGLNMGHAKWMVAAKGASFDGYRLKGIMDEHRRLHREIWLQRKAERERILAKMGIKLAKKQSNGSMLEISDKNNNDFGAKKIDSKALTVKKPLAMAKSLSVQSDKSDHGRKRNESSSAATDSDSDVDADAILKKYGEIVADSDSDDSSIEKYYVNSEVRYHV